MKLGAENKKKTAIAIGLAAVAIIVVVWQIYNPANTAAVLPPSATSTKVAGTTAPGTAKPRAGQSERHVAAVWTPTLDPRLRLDLLKDSEGLKYEGSGRNVFRKHLEEIPKPVAKGLIDKPIQSQPWHAPGLAPPPPINLKFSGWASQAGEPKAVLLSQGSEIYVAHEGEIIAGRYKILRINADSIDVQDVLNNNRQKIPLTQG
jgi:hypothetical protein